MTSPLKQSTKDFLVKINDVHKRIRLDDIFYLQSEGKYVSIIIENRSYSFRSTLKKLEQLLPDNFARIHSSYIVNLKKISVIKNQDHLIVLSNNVELAFSRTYKESLLSNFLLG